MTPPTQSDARWEPPEWLLEQAAAFYQFGVFPGDESEATEDELRTMARDFLTAALSECPVLGLTREEIAVVERFIRVGTITHWEAAEAEAFNSFKAKLLATREALERGSDA